GAQLLDIPQHHLCTLTVQEEGLYDVQPLSGKGKNLDSGHRPSRQCQACQEIVHPLFVTVTERQDSEAVEDDSLLIDFDALGIVGVGAEDDVRARIDHLLGELPLFLHDISEEVRARFCVPLYHLPPMEREDHEVRQAASPFDVFLDQQRVE